MKPRQLVNSLASGVQKRRVEILIGVGVVAVAALSWLLLHPTSKKVAVTESGFTKLSAEDVKRILLRYDVGELKSFKQLSGGLSNANYRVDTDRCTFLLKVCDEKFPHELDYQVRVMRVLDQHGIPIARCLPLAGPSDDQHCVLHNFPIGSRERSIICYEWIPGITPKSTAHMLRQLAVTAASFHSIPAMDFAASIAPNCEDCKIQISQLLPEFCMGYSQMRYFLDLVDGQAPQLASQPMPPQITFQPVELAKLDRDAIRASPFWMAFKMHFAELSDAARDSISPISPYFTASSVSVSSVSLPKGVLHSDLCRDNIMVAFDRQISPDSPMSVWETLHPQKLWAIDWEEVSYGPLIIDLALIVAYHCFDDTPFEQWPERTADSAALPPTRMNQQLLRSVIQGYQSKRTMSRAEQIALPDYIRFVNLGLCVCVCHIL